jgi:hypothetical protein
MGSAPLEGNAMIEFRILRILFTGILIFNVPFFSARGAANQDRQKPTVIVVVGAAGSEEYGAQFVESAGLWKQACSKGDAQLIAIGLDEVAEADDLTMLQGKLAGESKQANAAALWLVLIGHGTYDGKTAKFNLRGPDLSADDLADWLKPFSRPIAVINAASSSAPFLSKLSRQGRVVITATKSGFE